MLLECKHCGAPLDVQSGEHLTRCKYCGTVSRAKALKTVAPVTPPDWRPPPQWVPPPSARADSGRTLVYHASWAIGRLIRTVVTIAVLLLLLPIVLPLAIAWIGRSVTERDVQGALEAAKSAMQLAESRVRDTAEPGEQARVRVDLLTPAGAADLLVKCREQLPGEPVRVLEVLLYPTQAVFKVQDPKNGKHIDQYTFRDGKFDAPMPVNVQHLHGKLEQRLVDLDDVGLDRFETFVAAALNKLKIENGKVTHVIVEKPDGRRVTIRVYVASPRERGFVELDTTGKVRRVSQ